jgi:ADP-heptose:LPS heptosyltransferase
VPADIPYLHAAEDRLAKWRQRLEGTAMPRVGIAWSGNPRHQNDRNRSLALADLLPALAAAPVGLFSLQKELREGDASQLAAAGTVRHFGDELGDFAGTAALVALMDLVIAVDTSVAHLAGALGKPTWILLPYSPDWRWLLAREDSPWYPTARLFRQASAGDWAGVTARVGAALDRQFGAER